MEEVCHCEGGFEVSYAQALPHVAHHLLLLPVNLDVELSATSSTPCLSAHGHASCYDDNNKPLTLSASPNEMFSFLRVVVVMGSLHGNGNPN